MIERGYFFSKCRVLMRLDFLGFLTTSASSELSFKLAERVSMSPDEPPKQAAAELFPLEITPVMLLALELPGPMALPPPPQPEFEQPPALPPEPPELELQGGLAAAAELFTLKKLSGSIALPPPQLEFELLPLTLADALPKLPELWPPKLEQGPFLGALGPVIATPPERG
jgi:hypothetical protein